MTEVLKLRRRLEALLADYVGVYTLANGELTPAVAVRALSEPRKLGTRVSGTELVIERDPDIIPIQSQESNPSTFEWTIWLVAWSNTALADLGLIVAASFPNATVETIRVDDGSGPFNQMRITLQTVGQATVIATIKIVGFLRLESGDFLLQESGDKIQITALA
jgi:hypothetical protein